MTNPVVGPKTASELRAFADMPEPDYASEDDISSMVGMLSVGKAKRNMSKEETAAHLGQFIQVLAGARKCDLEAAYEELLRTHKFLPDVSEVYDCVKRFEAKRRYRKSRARFLAWKHDREWSPPVDPVTPEEAEQARAMVAAIAKQVEGNG